MAILNDADDIVRGNQHAEVVNLGTTPVWPTGDDAYIIKIKYSNYNAGGSKEFKLNFGGEDDTLDVHVDWGDGTSDDYSGYHINNWHPTHEGYVRDSEYIITVTGKFSKFTINSIGTMWADSVAEVLSWGSKSIGMVDAGEGFSGCWRLSSIPTDYRGFFTNTLYMDNLFSGTKLVEIPKGLLDKSLNLINAQGLFYSISTLKSYQPDLFYVNKKITNFRSTFLGCGVLESRTPIGPDGVELWQRSASNGYVDGIDGSYCFNSCSKMQNYSSIPCIGLMCWK